MDNFSVVFIIGILFVSAMIDFRKQRIPNLITYPGMVVAFSYHGAMRGADGLLFSLAGLAVGISIFLVPYLMGGMGAGDAKLMGVVGGMIGAKGVLYAFLCIVIVGGVYALVLILIHRQQFNGFFKKQFTSLWNFILTRKYTPNPNQAGQNSPKLCYGLAIALGTVLYVFLNISGYQIFK